MERIYNTPTIYTNQMENPFNTSATSGKSAYASCYSVSERLRLFASSVSDPHRFRVGDTAVEVLFDDGAPSLQSCLTNLCKRFQ